MSSGVHEAASAPGGEKVRFWFVRTAALCLFAAATSCGEYEPPPPHLAFGDLPVSGSLSDARYAGFGGCIEDTTSLRCFRRGVTFEGKGPFNAAVDLGGSAGSKGFAQVTLWHDRDQDAFLAVSESLKKTGWKECFTGNDRKGDQAVYSRQGERVKILMDLSYFGKRRLRIAPASSAEARC
ncbi:hypothetical protein [Sphingosinicella sp. BN140058]|uniref:hypothetical protein n=1 Tax=Sphingosinicella sp. BN140058 TaxID=1892855 RepID=UPI001FB13B0B|nr:hypothetical protein [Sphingosinicella sp. BN140058]